MKFPSTQWSLLAQATLNGDLAGQQALAEFHRQYRQPVVAFILRRGWSPHDAEDLAQGFFLHLMEQATLRRADATRGRVRCFLLGTLVRYLGHVRDHQAAQKRGGGIPPVSLEVMAETANEPTVPAADLHAYDRDWAVQL